MYIFLKNGEVGGGEGTKHLSKKKKRKKGNPLQKKTPTATTKRNCQVFSKANAVSKSHLADFESHCFEILYWVELE